MTNPTPTPREREAAHITKIALKYFRDNWQLRWALEHDIAAALARERREALTEAAQVSRNYWKTNYNALAGVTWIGDEIAAAIEALRDGAGL